MVSVFNSFSNTPAPSVSLIDFNLNHNFTQDETNNKFFTFSIDLKKMTFTDYKEHNNNNITKLLKIDPSRFDFIKTNLKDRINKEINNLYEDSDNEDFINTITYNLNDDLILNIEILFNEYIKPLISFECYICYKTLNNYVNFSYCDNIHEGARLCLECVKEWGTNHPGCPLCRFPMRDYTENTEENKHIRQYKFIMIDLNNYFKNNRIYEALTHENNSLFNFINDFYFKFNGKYYLMANLKLGEVINNLPNLNNWIYHNEFINILNNIILNEEEDREKILFNIMKEIFKFYFDCGDNEDIQFFNIVSSYVKIYNNIDDVRFNDIILLINSSYKFKRNYVVNLYYIYQYFFILFSEDDDKNQKLKDISNKIIRDEKFNNENVAIVDLSRNTYKYRNNKLYKIKYLNSYMDDLTLLYIERTQTDINHYSFNLYDLKTISFTILKDNDLYDSIKKDFEAGEWVYYYNNLYEATNDENYIKNFSVETFNNIINNFINGEASAHSAREFFNKTFRFNVDYDKLYNMMNEEGGHYRKKETVITTINEHGAGNNNEIRFFLYSDEWEDLTEIINIDDDDTSQTL